MRSLVPVLPPSMTTTQRDALVDPNDGSVIFNSTTALLERYDGTLWIPLGDLSSEANLSDLIDIVAARLNLGLTSVATETLEDLLESLRDSIPPVQSLFTGLKFETDTVEDGFVTSLKDDGLNTRIDELATGGGGFQDEPRRVGSKGAASIRNAPIDVATNIGAINDMGIGDSGVREVGVAPADILRTGWAHTATRIENERIGLPDPGVGFKFVAADETVFYGQPWWSHRTNGVAGTFGPSATPGGAPDQCWVLSTSGHKVGDTETFRRVGIIFEKQASGGAPFQVSVNNESTYSGDQSTTGSGYGVYLSADLGEPLERTMYVKQNGTGSVKIIGAIYYNTDAEFGSVFWNFAHGGTATADWTANRDWETALALVKPRRLFIGLTGNDMLNGIPFATAIANLETIVTRAKTASPFTEIVLMGYFYPEKPSIDKIGVGADVWEDVWIAGMRDLAVEQGCTFVNEFAVFGDLGEDADPLELTSDGGLHLGEVGHQMKAELYLDRLSYSTDIKRPVLREMAFPDEVTWGHAYNITLPDSGGQIVIGDVDIFSDGSVYLPVLGIKHAGDTHSRIAFFNGQIYVGDGVSPPLPANAGGTIVEVDANYAVAAGVRTVAVTDPTGTIAITLPPLEEVAANTQILVADISGICSSTDKINVEGDGADQIYGEAFGAIPLIAPLQQGIFTKLNDTHWTYRVTPFSVRTTTLGSSPILVPNEFVVDAALDALYASLVSYVDIADVFAVAFTEARSISGIYGDGSDGSVTFDGTTTILGIVPASSSYTLTRDIFLINCTINTGVTINPGGFRIFCQGTLTGVGTAKIAAGSLVRDGGSFTALFGGIAQGAGTIGGSQAGVNGTNGAGGSTSAIINSMGGRGGAGGAGATAAGSSGTVTAPVAGAGTVRQLPQASMAALLSASLAFTPVTGGTGGGAGGGNGTTNFGGPSGAGGAILVLHAYKIAGSLTLDAKGGNGGPATGAGNSGGGGGGGGGLIIVISKTPTIPTCLVTGGTGGAKLGTGAIGSNGSDGTVIRITG